jgi:pimeloyl-ACP methyl ester carboxylesterase
VERALIATPSGYVHYAARGAGPPLVLLHPSARSGRMYHGVAARLADVARTYAVDLPNYGASDRVVGPVTMDVFVAAVREVATAAGAPVVVGGAAMGAYISVEFALRYPDLVRGVILQSCPFYLDGAEATARHASARLPYRTDESGFPLPRTLAEVRANDLAHAPARPDQDWLDQVNQDLIAAGRRFWDGMPVVAGYDLRAALPRLAVPVLMIWGKDFLYARRREEIAGRVRDGRVELIEGAGLHPEIDNPAGYDAAVRGFLAELAG